MNADKAPDLLLGDVSEAILGCFFDVYNELGPGFLESVYENALALVLREAGLTVRQQQPLSVSFRGESVGEFRADLMVNQSVIVEVKAATALTTVHEAQLIHYLKATGVQLGLLLNFGPKPEFRRKIYTKN